MELDFRDCAELKDVHGLNGLVPAELKSFRLDLRECNLTREDGLILAEALDKIPRLTSIDVRGNPELEGDACAAMIAAMRHERPGHPRSICGVSALNTRLEVPRKFDLPRQIVDLELIAADGTGAIEVVKVDDKLWHRHACRQAYRYAHG